MLLEMGSSVNSKDNEGRTPLHMCVESLRDGTLACMEVLTQFKVRVDEKDINGSTPLHRAALGRNKLILIPLPFHDLITWVHFLSLPI